MFLTVVTVSLLLCLVANPCLALAAGTPVAEAKRASRVSVTRDSAENPMVEIARSTFWGAMTGLLVGSAISLVDDGHSGEPVRWGIVLGTFAGLGAGIYFVAHRPSSSSLLELHESGLIPSAEAIDAIEPVPGGVRVHALGVRF